MKYISKALLGLFLFPLVPLAYSQDLSAGLIGHWRFDELQGQVAVDSSGQGNDGQLHGPHRHTGKMGGGLDFDGQDDYVDLGPIDVSSTAPDAGFALSVWFKADTFLPGAADNRLVSKATGTAEQDHYWMLSTISSGGAIRLRFRLKAGSKTATLIASKAEVPTGVWVHAAAVHNGNEMILYQDGVEVGHRWHPGSIETNSSAPAWIGDNPGGGRPFDGLIDQVRLYDRALSASEVRRLFELDEQAPVNTPPTAFDQEVETEEDAEVEITLNGTDPDGDDLTFLVSSSPSHGVLGGSGPNLTYTPHTGFHGQDSFEFDVADNRGGSDRATVSITVIEKQASQLTDGLQGHWTFDEQQGSTAFDSSGAERHAELRGAQRTEGRISRALWFDGTDDYVDAGSFDIVPDAQNPGRFTIAAWFKAESFLPRYADNRIISKATGVNDQDHYWMLSTIHSSGDTRLRFRLKTNGSTQTLIGSSSVALGQWVHAAAVYDGTQMRIYQDGIEVGRRSKSGAVSQNSGVPVWIGRNPGGERPFHGIIDDVRIYNRALAPEEVFQLSQGVNQPPVAQDQELSSSQDQPVSFTLQASDPDGDNLIYVVTSQPANGSLSGSAPSLTYTPDAGFHGSDSFTYEVSDPEGATGSATVSIIVQEPNNPPQAADLSVSTDEGVAVSVTLQGSDPDGDSLAYAVTSQPASGSLSGSAPSLTYTPDAGFHGADSFTYEVSDPDGAAGSATVSITVQEVNNPPQAADLSVSTDEGVAVSVTLQGSDPDGDSLAYAVTSQPASGSLSGSAPSLTYTPDAGFHGADSFTYEVSDPQGAADSATVSITVQEVMDGTLISGAVGRWSFEESGGETATDSSGNGNDGSLSGPSRTAGITGGGLDFDGSGDYVDLGGLAVDASGAAQGLTIAAWFKADSFLSRSADNRIVSKATGISEQDHYWMLSTISSNNAVRLRFRLKTNGSTATLIANGTSVSTGEWVHAVATYDGTRMRLYQNGQLVGEQSKSGSVSENESVSAWIGDNPGGGKSFDGLIDEVGIYNRALTLEEIAALIQEAGAEPFNNPPVALDVNVTTEQETSASITFDVTDPDGDPLTIEVTSGPANGTVTGSGSEVVYTPFSGFTGTDSFTYRATDTGGKSDSAKVNITVTESPATLALSSASVSPGGTATLDLSLQLNGGRSPAALQWTVEYDPAVVSGIEATLGPAASASAKELRCNTGDGASVCVLSGMNMNEIPAGVTASIQLHVSASAPSGTAQLHVTGAAAAAPSGDRIPSKGVSGSVEVLSE